MKLTHTMYCLLALTIAVQAKDAKPTAKQIAEAKKLIAVVPVEDLAGVTYGYHNDQITKMVDAKGVTTLFTYDLDWNLIQINHPSGAVTKHVYNKDGKKVRSEHYNPTGKPILILTYDEKERVIRQEVPIGKP